MTTTRADRIQALVWLEQLAAKAAARAAELRAELNDEAMAAFRSSGGMRQSWELKNVATVYQSLTADKVEITSDGEPDFVAYVAQQYPTEADTRTVTTVKPAFVKALLGRVSVVDGAVIDPQTDTPVPGARWIPGGTPTKGVTVKPTCEAVDVYGALAEEFLASATAATTSTIGAVLAELLAKETPGEVMPGEITEAT